MSLEPRESECLFDIQAILNQQLAVLNRMMEKIMSTTPVSQASFDAALAQYTTSFNALLTAVGSVETGLSAVEAALVAAQGSQTPVDLSGELATLQNLQAEVSSAQTSAQAAIAGLPTAPTPTPTPSVHKAT
jgi:hypothetical protein